MTAQSRLLAFLVGVDVLLIVQTDNVRRAAQAAVGAWLGLLQ